MIVMHYENVVDMIDMSCVIVWIVEYYVYYLNCDIVLNGENHCVFVH